MRGKALVAVLLSMVCGIASGQQEIKVSYQPALYWSLPNLDRLDLKGDAAAGVSIETLRVTWAMLYTALYSGALLFASMLLFQRRDFR